MTVIKYVWSSRGKAPKDILRDDVRFLVAALGARAQIV